MKPKTNQFNVLVSELRAAMLFASNDESRYVLNSLHFEVRPNTAPVIVATDGRRLAAISSEAEQAEGERVEFSFTVAVDFLKPLCGFAKSFSAVITIEYHPSERVVFLMSGNSLVVDCEKGAVIEATYPAWRQVIPSGEKEQVPEFGVNAEMMADFSKVSKYLGVETPMIKVNLFNATAAMEVNIAGKPNFYAVIMPAKPSETENWQPEFIGLEAPKQKAA